jgi:hypothetical protein
MAECQQIILQQGPLPIEVTATIETDGPTVVSVAGSVWTTTQNTPIGVALVIDDELAIKAPIYSNQPNEHRTFVPVTFPYTFTIGQHKFLLQGLNPATTSDGGDYFVVTVLY